MHATFNIERERNSSLFYKSYPNSHCQFQFHSPIELYFIEKGEMEILVNGIHQTLKAPAVCVVLSYNTHAYRTPVFSYATLLVIPTHLCEEFTQAIHGKQLVSPFITDPEAYTELKAAYDMIVAFEANKVKQRGAVYMLLGTLLEHLFFTEAKEEMDTTLASQILFYIEENHASNITLSTVSNHFGYSESHISRYFKASFGITLSHYLTTVRLRHAIMLMCSGKHDITYCALEAGFASMRTFYRAFHEEFGMTPTDFIKSEKSNLH